MKFTFSSLRDRLATPLGLHLAGVTVLALLTLTLTVRLALDWSAAFSDALTTKQFQLKALDLQTAPLRGLDQRVGQTRGQILAFYQKRIPANYSAIAGRVGQLAVDAGARLTRVQYAQAEAHSDLAEISLDMSVAGSYTQIMRYVNALERDSNFFVVRAMALNEQQGGQVNLRLRVSTWMRPSDAGIAPPDDTEKPAQSGASAKEGK